MLLLLAGAVLLTVYVIPGDWGFVLVALAVVLAVAEGVLFRSTRRMPPAAGVETMIGDRAVVVSGCRPAGRVRYRRESWKARCPDGAGAEVGQTVVIESIENMTLVVSPVPDQEVSGRC